MRIPAGSPRTTEKFPVAPHTLSQQITLLTEIFPKKEICVGFHKTILNIKEYYYNFVI